MATGGQSGQGRILKETQFASVQPIGRIHGGDLLGACDLARAWSQKGSNPSSRMVTWGRELSFSQAQQWIAKGCDVLERKDGKGYEIFISDPVAQAFEGLGVRPYQP